MLKGASRWEWLDRLSDGPPFEDERLRTRLFLRLCPGEQVRFPFCFVRSCGMG